jgi:hypothetical protein
MPNQWFIDLGSGTQGPLDDLQLKKLAEGGQLMPTTRVRLGQGGHWSTAAAVKGLFPSPSPPRINQLHNPTFSGASVAMMSDEEPMPRDAPTKEFEKLKSEQKILWNASYACTIPGAICLVISGFVLVLGVIALGALPTPSDGLQVLALGLSLFGMAVTFLVIGVLLRVVCGAVDLGLYASALLEDIRQHSSK